jgi:hypothetical protein
MPLIAESAETELQRAELQAVLQSELFVRSPALSNLLTYLCEKLFAGEAEQIKEYSIALEVFGRSSSFDQDTDSIVRVQANRLRKRLVDYYSGPGADHRLRITIPVGKYIPLFTTRDWPEAGDQELEPPVVLEKTAASTAAGPERRSYRWWVGAGVIGAGVLALMALGTWAFLARPGSKPAPVIHPAYQPEARAEVSMGLPVGDEIRILAGADRSYVDRAGKLWSGDAYFEGGAAVRSPMQHIWRTQDPSIYRSSRQGDFSYNIPLKRGLYELRLHFAETFYGPEDVGDGGEGSRVMTVIANGKALLANFDVLTDAGGSRTADVKVFTEISPASDGQLHLNFLSVHGGRAMLSAIEILPGLRGRMRPVRIVTRDVPYYSNDSHWWSPDTYFKGGQLAASEKSAADDDPELYETERWGHFSYAIPVAPGKYDLILHFIERGLLSAAYTGNQEPGTGLEHAGRSRVFDAYCNGKTIIRGLNILEEVGENRPLVRKITGLEPNAQGKLLLEFVPIRDYATVTAIEVLPQ